MFLFHNEQPHSLINWVLCLILRRCYHLIVICSAVCSRKKARNQSVKFPLYLFRSDVDILLMAHSQTLIVHFIPYTNTITDKITQWIILHSSLCFLCQKLLQISASGNAAWSRGNQHRLTDMFNGVLAMYEVIWLQARNECHCLLREKHLLSFEWPGDVRILGEILDAAWGNRF